MRGHAPDKPLTAAQVTKKGGKNFRKFFKFCYFQEELRKFNAKRRWKSAIITVVAANKFKTMMQMKKVREAKPRKAKNLRLSSLKNMFTGKK